MAVLISLPLSLASRLGRGKSTEESNRGVQSARGEAELLDAIPDLIAVDAEQLAGLGLIATATFQRLHQELTLDLFKVHTFDR